MVLFADDMGFSDIGCFGSEIATPNIDRLAAGGLRFTHFYNAGRCCPSRASILTGLHPHQADIGHMAGDLIKTPFRRYKRQNHEGGISAPFVVHWPRGIAAVGQLRHQPAHLIDLMPTFVQAAGAEYPPEFRGRSIQPMQGRSLIPFFDSDRIEPRTLYWEHEGNRAILQIEQKEALVVAVRLQVIDDARDLRGPPLDARREQQVAPFVQQHAVLVVQRHRTLDRFQQLAVASPDRVEGIGGIGADKGQSLPDRGSLVAETEPR